MGRMVMLVIGALLFLVGILWILQGLDVIGGSGMSGHGIFAVLGVIVAIVGAFLFVRTIRTPAKRNDL